jgi:hypothetical protein
MWDEYCGYNIVSKTARCIMVIFPRLSTWTMWNQLTIASSILGLFRKVHSSDDFGFDARSVTSIFPGSTSTRRKRSSPELSKT